VKESGSAGAGAAGGGNAGGGAGGAAGGNHGNPGGTGGGGSSLLSEKEKKWMCSIRALSIMLKSWTGLIVLASHPLGLKAVVDALRLPCHELHVCSEHHRICATPNENLISLCVRAMCDTWCRIVYWMHCLISSG
jgi:hypothetical protein